MVGTNILAAPILGPGRVLRGSVAVIDSVQFLPQQRSRHQIARVMAAARQITRLLGTEAGDERPASARQPVVKVRRRTEADEAPGSQGAKRENTGSI